MSRDFDGSTQSLENSNAFFTGPPFSVSVWANPDQLTNSATIWALTKVGDSNQRFRGYISGSSDKFIFHIKDSGGSCFLTTEVATIGEWFHAGCAEAANNDHRAYFNGNKFTSTDTCTPTGLDQTQIGVSLNADDFDGKIGHLAFWNVALTDSEFLSLAAGVSPRKIRIGNLTNYIPINGQSPELDVVGGLNMTLINAPLKDEEPPIPYSIVAPGG